MKIFGAMLVLLLLAGCASDAARREKVSRQVYRTCVKYQTAEKCTVEREIWRRQLEGK